MTDPVAPQLPADAPQDAKDFFDCKGDKLVWKKGKVSWLGLAVDPDVSFDHGKAAGSINVTVTIGMSPFSISFTLPASVNAAGELVVDTTSIPDLSGIDKDLPGKPGVDKAIKNINDWFKKNGKKLKPPVLKGGQVTLEKTALAAAPPPLIAVKPEPPKPIPPPPAVTPGATIEPKKESGGWCSLLGGILVFMFFGVIAFGGAIGFAMLGGPPQTPFNPGQTSLPSLTATSVPTTVATATPEAATASPAATGTPVASSTPGTIGEISDVCVRVHHQELEQFVSYMEWLMFWSGVDVDHFDLYIAGTNDDLPIRLDYDSSTGAWGAPVGLHGAGEKQIVSLIAHLPDGQEVDLTDDLIEYFGTDLLEVRFPQEDTFGECPTA